jgi:hypothetical protein
MSRTARQQIVTLALALTLALAPTGGALADIQNETTTADQDRHPADRIGGYVFDGLILRPTGAVLLVVGSVFAIPSYPIAMISGSQQAVLERCVLDPYDYTVPRAFGDF